MNYVQPTQDAFIVPRGTKLKRAKDYNRLKVQKDFLKNCLNNKKSKNGKRVYDIVIDDE